MRRPVCSRPKPTIAAASVLPRRLQVALFRQKALLVREAPGQSALKNPNRSPFSTSRALSDHHVLCACSTLPNVCCTCSMLWSLTSTASASSLDLATVLGAACGRAQGADTPSGAQLLASSMAGMESRTAKGKKTTSHEAAVSQLGIAGDRMARYGLQW